MYFHEGHILALYIRLISAALDIILLSTAYHDIPNDLKSESTMLQLQKKLNINYFANILYECCLQIKFPKSETLTLDDYW